MTAEKKRKTDKGVSLAVIAAGFAVIIGWIFDIGILKSISPAWVTMNSPAALAIEGVNSAIAFNTAALFVILGIGFICL
jgi:hypothetical protein